MSTYTFIVEKTSTGYATYAKDFEKFPVFTTGGTIQELKHNILEAANLYQDEMNGRALTEKDIIIRLDLKQFFEYYRVLTQRDLRNVWGCHGVY